jgi:hypothetical protein
MVTSDEIVKKFQQELLSRSEEERIEYLRQLGFSITQAKEKQKVGAKPTTPNRYVSIVDKKLKRAVRGSIKREGVVTSRLQAN